MLNLRYSKRKNQDCLLFQGMISCEIITKSRWFCIVHYLRSLLSFKFQIFSNKFWQPRNCLLVNGVNKICSCFLMISSKRLRHGNNFLYHSYLSSVGQKIIKLHVIIIAEIGRGMTIHFTNVFKPLHSHPGIENCPKIHI